MNRWRHPADQRRVRLPGPDRKAMVMISIISAVIAVLGAITTAVLGYRVQAQLKSRERMDYMGRYRDSLLWAAFDLQSRIYNILRGFEASRRPYSKGFLGAFLVEGTERQVNYVRRSTAFVFAEYLGWVEIFRRDLQFLDLGDSRTNRRTMFLLATISETFSATSTSETECFRIFRPDQRAIGEIMIAPDSKPGELRCLGYAAFDSMFASGETSAEWIQELIDHVDLAAREPAMAQDRLTSLQHHLIDLIDLLDPGRQRFPAKLRSRFALEK
jgi:hypothetical protein